MLAIHLNKELSLMCIYGIYRNSLSLSRHIYLHVSKWSFIIFFPSFSLSSSRLFFASTIVCRMTKFIIAPLSLLVIVAKKNVFLPSGMLKGSFSSVTFCFTSLFLLLYYHHCKGKRREEKKANFIALVRAL
jgi:hypothetical protein